MALFQGAVFTAFAVHIGVLCAYRKGRLPWAEQILHGFWGGFFLVVFIYCALWQAGNAPPGMGHLVLMAGGMAIAILLETMGAAFALWVFTGIAAGSQIGLHYNGAYYLMVMAVFILTTDLAAMKFSRRTPGRALLGFLLFFTGAFLGLAGRAFSVGSDYLLCTGGGAIIYFCCGRALPDREKGQAYYSSIMGALAGFAAGIAVLILR